jgi:hypothetical protein
MIKFDIEKGRDIAKKLIRTAREPYLQIQDVAFQRALEDGIDTGPVVAEKQRLRDLTNPVDTATSESELLTVLSEVEL